MASRTSLYSQLPWIGGLNSSIDESMIPGNQLTVADNLIFDVKGSRKKRDGITHNWDDVAASTAKVIGQHDFWFGTTTRTQRHVRVLSNGKVYSTVPGTGAATELTVGGTAWSGTLTTCSMITFGNLVIIAVDGASNVVKYWDGDVSHNVLDAAATAPLASILRVCFGRIFCNDKANPDLLHYSPVGDYSQWYGAGDSGAIPIGEGDGDPVGLTAIFPEFKSSVYVAKKTKLYRVPIDGFPEQNPVVKVSDGIGCVSHNSCAPIDETDVMFVSQRGVHSLAATDLYGDFDTTFVSYDIQKTFNEDIDNSRLPFVFGAYLDRINSVAFTFTETSSLNRSLTTSAVNNTIYLYNIPLKSWFRWPDLPCSSLIVSNDSDKKRFYLGTHTNRVSKSFTGSNSDTSTAGATVAIRMRIVTGQIFPDNSPYSMKAFKRLILFYRPRGTHSISASVKIDNVPLSSENTLTFQETSSSALLGSTFTLGSSTLGYDVVLGPYTRMVDGYGRGFKLTLETNDTGSEVDIQGFALEYEPSGQSPETFLSQAS